MQKLFHVLYSQVSEVAIRLEIVFINGFEAALICNASVNSNKNSLAKRVVKGYLQHKNT